MAKILVVDDRVENRSFLAKLLGYVGHELLEASDGAEALEVTRQEHPDLVIVDLLMPVMDGYEYVHKLREEPVIGGTPVIFYTATYLASEAAAIGKMCGVEHILQKPAVPATILSTVATALGTRAEPIPELAQQDFRSPHTKLIAVKLKRKLETVVPRMAALIELGTQMTVEADPLQLLQTGCEAVREVVGARYTAVAVRESDESPIVHFFSSGMDEATSQKFQRLLEGDGLLAKTLAHRDTLRFRDLGAEGSGLLAECPYLESLLSITMATAQGLYGRIYFAEKLAGGEFDDGDEEFAVAFAGQFAVAYENARRKTSLIERHNLATLSAEVGLSLINDYGLPEMLQHCAESMVANLDAAFARIWTLNSQGDMLELRASAGMYTHLDGEHSRIPVGAYKIGLIAQERAPHLTNSVANDPRISDPEWAKREGMVAFAGYPLIVDGRLVGVMAMFARRRLTQATLDAMAAVANQIAAGIERKRARERLQFTQFTIDHVATSVFWADADGRFFNVNEAACSLTGYSRDELLSLSVSDVDTSVSRENWQAAWTELRERGTLAFESQLRRKGGSEVPVSVNSNLLESEGRQFSCTFIQDITRQKFDQQNQQRLACERDNLLRQLQLQIERLPLAYLLFDAELRLTDWNPAAEKIFGYGKDEMLGMAPPFEKILSASAWEQAQPNLRRLREGDMTVHAVNENLTKDGRTITCEWINTPLLAEDGSFSGLMCLALDVTERKHLEDQYRQAQKMEAVGKLAGGVAHDFNNMLTIILGYTQMIRETLRESDPLRELVEQVEQAGKRGAGLTRQLLAFSRKQVLAPVLLDMKALLTNMESMLSRLIGEDVELSIRTAEDLWQVRADAGQVEQVIMNLAVNARDAMPQGGKLTVECDNIELDEQYAAHEPGAQPGKHVRLAVTDTGCGMDEATMARIFEPFFSTKGEMGTGLGLATVYGIVRQSGGHITAYSEPGVGTTFKIYLPRDGEDSQIAPSADTSKGGLGGSETMLLVEDEEGVRSLARLALQRRGYKVLEAPSGAEALKISERYDGDIQLLATDVVMPQMSGRELADRLLSLRPGIRVLYMSGYTDDAIVRHGLLDARVPFLHKPFTLDALARKVREVLDCPLVAKA
jgi:PAS domain S-box-containing protein